MTAKELKNFIYGNYYRQLGFSKENSYNSITNQKKNEMKLFETKLTEKIPEHWDPKKYYH